MAKKQSGGSGGNAAPAEATFEQKVEKRVDSIAKSLDKLANLVESRPDQWSDERQKQTFDFIESRVSGVAKRAEIAMETGGETTSQASFSLS